MKNLRETGDSLQNLIASSYEDGQFLLRMIYENAYFQSRRNLFEFEATHQRPTIKDLEDDLRFSVLQTYLFRTAENPGSPRILILCNDFMSEDRLYTSPFLYRRIKEYQRKGAQVDVVAFGRSKLPEVYEFDGIQVLNGYVDELSGLLSSRSYRSVGVHFFNPHMWSVIREYLDEHTFHLFLHGYEIRNWTRSFDSTNSPSELSQAIERSFMLMDFLRHILDQPNFPSSFVFVSDWMRRSAEEDIGRPFPKEKSHIIHNVIDVDLFSYTKKYDDQRFKILIIRNFDKYQYGTDIALEALKIIKRSEFWPRITVSIFGEGAGLRDFSNTFKDDHNVKVDARYLTQTEMAMEHRSSGVFLVPTRFDSQGVARDEAMSSGLVVATNSVCAIPEFVDDSCALLAPPEDAHALATKILALMADPARFKALSKASAQHVRKRLVVEQTIQKELDLLLA